MVFTLCARSVHFSAKYELKRPHFFLVSDKNNKNNFFTLWKVFQSNRSSSVTKLIHFNTTFYNALNQTLTAISDNTTNWKEEKMHFILGSFCYIINCSMWHHF